MNKILKQKEKRDQLEEARDRFILLVNSIDSKIEELLKGLLILGNNK